MPKLSESPKPRRASDLSGPASLFSVSDVQTILSLSRTSVWRLVRGGVLTTVEIGGRRLVTRASLERIVREGAPHVA